MCVALRSFFFRMGISFCKNPRKTCFFCASVHVDIKNDYKNYMFTCLHVLRVHIISPNRIILCARKTCRHVAQNCICGTCGGQRGTCGSQRGTVSTISQHTQTQTQDDPATLPSAASPSLSMEPSAMGPNRGAAAPCKPIAGTRRPGARALLLIPLFGAPKWHPSK